MKTRSWNVEHTLYTLAALIAIGVRFTRLGSAPLSDFEAGWALQALALARGEQVAFGPQPAYVVLTSVLFFIFDGTGFLARFWPALAGASLVMLPLVFRRWIGRLAALILAFGLALDPGLVAVSQMAGGPTLALAFGLFAMAALTLRRPALAGILGGFALLSGTAIVYGALALAITWGLSGWLDREAFQETQDDLDRPLFRGNLNGAGMRVAFFWLAGAILFAGTLFMRAPQSLGALAATLPAYFEGWIAPSGVPALRLPAALLIYQPLVVIFAAIGAVRAWVTGYPHNGFLKKLSLWAVIALVLAMVYPARQVGDLAWVLVPLWALASAELAHQLTRQSPQYRLVSTGQAVLVFLLLVFAWLIFANLGNVRAVITQEVMRNAAVLIFGALAMAVLTTALVGLGWSGDTARRGIMWGITGAMALYMLSGVAGAAQLRRGWEQELWTRSPVTGQADLLLSTLGDLSAWQTGHRSAMDLVVFVEVPSLQWALKDWPQARFGTALTPGEMPPAIIASFGQETPGLAATYRGQDFAWQIYPAWQGVLPNNLPQWLAFREAPHQHNQVILWARSDLFPDGSLSHPGELEPLLEDEDILLEQPGVD